MKTITYAICLDDGLTYSRCGDQIAVPVLQYEEFGKDGDFTKPFRYKLEKTPILDLAYCWPRFRWTKKIPNIVKNVHREFWGMKPLKLPGKV